MGVNAIVLSVGEILIVRHNYGEKKLALPGGGIEETESPTRAVVREVMEETGIHTLESDYRPIAIWCQHNGNLVGLLETLKFSGQITITRPDEILWAGFMSIEEILSRKNDFGLGYLRMILQYMRCINGYDHTPHDGGRLGKKVTWPDELEQKYRSNVLQV